LVDLTPVLPGGENGGAKVFVLELLRRLTELAPQTQFVLLTQATQPGHLLCYPWEKNLFPRFGSFAEATETGSWRLAYFLLTLTKRPAIYPKRLKIRNSLVFAFRPN